MFKDAPLLNAAALPAITQVRDGVGIDRDLGAAHPGVKYDFEVVVPGASFGVEILAENVTDWELGLLLAILRTWEEGHLAVGGKTSRGLGWGRLKDLSVQRVERPALVRYLTSGTMDAIEPQALLEAFERRLNSQGTDADYA